MHGIFGKGGGNNTPFPTNDPELAKAFMQANAALQKAIDENTEVSMAVCDKCGISDLTMVLQAEVYIVRMPAMPSQGINEAKEEMVPRTRIIQFYCPNCGDLVAQKVLFQSGNPNVIDKDQVETKELVDEQGNKIVVPDIEKDLEEALPLKDEDEGKENEESPSSTT